MDDQTRQRVVNRLKSAAGHINGVVSMVEDDRYCVDIIKQIQAVQAALARTSEVILGNHLNTCVTTAMQSGDSGEREQAITEILEVFRTENRS